MNLRFLTPLLACGIVLTLTASAVITPLWLDSIPNHKGNETNVTSSCSTNDFRHVDGFSILLQVSLFFLIISGLWLLCLRLCFKHKLTEADFSFPKQQFLLIGFSDAVSSICFVYASSGSRTAPYLQSLAVNFAIPVTFIIRFILLKKRPSQRKTIAALIVLAAEFVALIPSIFPSLESTKTKHEEGGASGVAGVLWPLCFALGFIPQGVVNVMIEKTTKSTRRTQSGSPGHVHPVYLMFWSFMFCFVSIAALFWTDIIPGFGMTKGISDFGEVFLFNLKCFTGIDYCTKDVHIFAWTCMFAMLTNRILVIIFLRISEGANYLVVIQSLQTPLVLLFWTLFEENPFRWNPYGHLSTWLSIVAVVFMLPAIFLYNKGDSLVVTEEVRNPLLAPEAVRSTISYQSIQADVMVDSSRMEEYSSFTMLSDESFIR